MFSFYSFAFFWHHNYVSVQFFTFFPRRFLTCVLVSVVAPKTLAIYFILYTFRDVFLLDFSSARIHFRNQELFTVLFIEAVWKNNHCFIYVYLFFHVPYKTHLSPLFLFEHQKVFFKSSFFFNYSNCRHSFRFSKFLNFKLRLFFFTLLCDLRNTKISRVLFHRSPYD